METANIRAKLPAPPRLVSCPDNRNIAQQCAPPRPPGPGRHKHLYRVCNFRSLVAIFLDLDIWIFVILLDLDIWIFVILLDLDIWIFVILLNLDI